MAKSIEELIEAGNAIDPSDASGTMTKAGRALEKHGSRPASVFPKATGDVAAKNSQGAAALSDILHNVGTIEKANRFGGADYVATDGRGARFDRKGEFMGFLEP
jgi:filamentous hemagglutinin